MTDLTPDGDVQPNASEPEQRTTELTGPRLFPPVSVDELSFATSFFVGVAKGQLQPASVASSAVAVRAQTQCTSLLQTLAGPRPAAASFQVVPSQVGPSRQRTLDATFLALWMHYEAEPCRLSLCARVLGFYLLMERSAGTAMQAWLHPCSDSADAVLLDPVVLEALATVELSSEGVLLDALLLAQIEILTASLQTIPR